MCIHLLLLQIDAHSWDVFFVDGEDNSDGDHGMHATDLALYSIHLELIIHKIHTLTQVTVKSV